MNREKRARGEVQEKSRNSHEGQKTKECEDF